MTPFQYIVYNGNILSKDDLPVIDTAWINVYEVVRVQHGVVLFAEDHFERLIQSLKTARFTIDLNFEIWLSQLSEIVMANNVSDTNLRIDYYGENEKCHHQIVSCINSHYPTVGQQTNGVSAILQFDERENPNAKITNAEIRAKANEAIAQQQVYETLLVNHNNQITEGSRSNFFAVKNNALYTAPNSMVLQGIMRLKVLQAASVLGLQVMLEPVTVNDLSVLNAAFITGTSPRVLALNSVEGIALNHSHPLINALYNFIEHEIDAYIKNH